MSEAAGKINVYVCPQGHRTITQNKDEGTTPFMILCKHEGCKQDKANPLNASPGAAELAKSSFYRVDQMLVAEWEWYRPSKQEALTKAEREYVKHGGLLLRKKS